MFLACTLKVYVKLAVIPVTVKVVSVMLDLSTSQFPVALSHDTV
jgi:hypothetical protein